MKIGRLHSWDVDFDGAIALQRELRSRIETGPALDRFQTIAGADVSYNRGSNTLYACVVVLNVPDLTLLEAKTAIVETCFPYRTGLLTFREAPALLAAFRKLRTRPDVVMIDGQGLAHPRRIGIASHLGLWLGIPSFGCAKTRLIGEYREPRVDAGSKSPLYAGKEAIGCVLRTKRRCNPLFVSIGHKIDLASAVRIARQTTRRHRIPEPTRIAHERVNAFRRACMAVKGKHE